MTTENIKIFNSLMNYLLSHQYITTTEFNNHAQSCGYSNVDIIFLYQHLLNSKKIVIYEGKIFLKKKRKILTKKNS